MTYVIRSYVVFFSIFLIATNSSLLYSQNYYSWNSNTGNNAIIGILLDTDIMVTGEPIQPGDEIGVFTPEGLCVGGIKWCGEKNHALTVWGNNEMTTDTIDGIQEGEEMQFRIWRQETETEYEIAIPVYSLGDGVYTTNGVYVLETLTVEGISFYPIRPQNYEVDVSINPELTWESLDDVESYSVQIATDEMFDTIDLQFDNINTTSIVLENLDYLTTYYWRVGALMDDGSYYWTRMMTFTTESELRPTPPALVHPGSGAMQVDISPVLSWNSKGDDVSYNLQIALDQEFMGVQQTMDDIPDTTIMVSNLNYGVRYYWRVQASNNEGTSDWSTVRYFTTRNEVDSTKIYFSSGWNMVSSYIKPENASMEHTLTDIENNYVLIKDGAGKVYWPDAEIYELDTWEVGQGYQIYMHSQDSLVITGNKIVVDSSPIELEQGWNAIAYLHESPLPITEALNSIDDYIELVKTIDGHIYWPDEDWNTIHNMFPGFGYYRDSDIISM